MNLDNIIQELEYIMSKLDKSSYPDAKYKIVAYAKVIKTLQLYVQSHSAGITKEKFKEQFVDQFTKPM